MVEGGKEQSGWFGEGEWVEMCSGVGMCWDGAEWSVFVW